MTYTLVEYFSCGKGYACGYCKGETTNFSHGMWAHTLTPADYKELIDRGWRRSGKYCYKPLLHKTCCPQYTIRCSALDFTPSRSQKKVLKRFAAFVRTGKRPPSRPERETEGVPMERPEDLEEKFAERIQCKEEKALLTSKKTPSGPDPSKPLPRKAKEIRLERRKEKVVGKTPSKSQVKGLDDFVEEIEGIKDPAHRFSVRLVEAHVGDPIFDATLASSYAVYQKYQKKVHHDSTKDCSLDQFLRFLCNSSLFSRDGYGAFHLQYLIDDEIIAVGVIDVLPGGVSSVYFYYDTDYSFLSLGTFSALWEIGCIRRREFLTSEEIPYYYMGFYIHSCPKMLYKSQYAPSFLLCPESMAWIPVDKCILKLDESKYARLNPDTGAVDLNFPKDYSNTLIQHQRKIMTCGHYFEFTGFESYDGDVIEYSNLVGKRLACKMVLYRSRQN